MFAYFTIVSANKALPMVIKKFNTILKNKEEFMKIQQQLETSLTIHSSFEDSTKLKQQLNSALTKFYKSIEDLEETGVAIKGIDEGLLDFPSKRYDEEVWLCWKYGEKEIKFWHEKDVGFSGRKPISVSNESLV